MDPLEQIEQHVGSLSLEFVEGLLADYLRDPDSVSPDWRSYFDEITRASGGNGNGARPRASAGQRPRPESNSNRPIVPSQQLVRAAAASARPHAENSATSSSVACAAATGGDQWHIAVLQDRVDQLVRAYRVRGHLVAQIDPLGLPRPDCRNSIRILRLHRSRHGSRFSTDTIEGPQGMTLRRILERLRNTYCRSIGVQFMHMDDLKVRQWLQERMEGTENRCTLSRREQLRILTRPDRRRGVRGIHPKPIPRREELFARRGRNADSAVGPGDRKGRRAQDRRNRAGHGPPRPAERAGQHHGQEPAATSSASSPTSIPNCTSAAAT